MEWIEANIYTTSQGVEAVCALLMENGVSSTQIQDDLEMLDFIGMNPFNWDYVDEELANTAPGEVYVKFYLSNTPPGLETVENIKKAIEELKSKNASYDLGRLQMEWEIVDDSEWSDNWKKYYKPFKIGQNIVIKPDWEPYTKEPGETVFTINPGNLFGTGLHQSTRLCVEQIEKYVSEESTVVDLGCGTGILSIISLMLGAKRAFAADMEPGVTEIVEENARKNSIEPARLKVRCGNVLTGSGLLSEIRKETYNVALVNIVADVIIELTPLIYEILDENGVFIASGIIKERTEDVRAALLESNFTVIDNIAKDEWVCLVSKKERKC